MPLDDDARIRHMVDYAELALRSVAGRTRGDLDRDEILTLALTRAVEIIGEAARSVSPAGRARLPDVPWEAIVGMRNRLVHAYIDINVDILWNTVIEALPALLTQLRQWVPKD